MQEHICNQNTTKHTFARHGDTRTHSFPIISNQNKPNVSAPLSPQPWLLHLTWPLFKCEVPQNGLAFASLWDSSTSSCTQTHIRSCTLNEQTEFSFHVPWVRSLSIASFSLTPHTAVSSLTLFLDSLLPPFLCLFSNIHSFLHSSKIVEYQDMIFHIARHNLGAQHGCLLN